MQAYLGEFRLRFNRRRFFEGQLFDKPLNACIMLFTDGNAHPTSIHCWQQPEQSSGY